MGLFALVELLREDTDDDLDVLERDAVLRLLTDGEQPEFRVGDLQLVEVVAKLGVTELDKCGAT